MQGSDHASKLLGAMLARTTPEELARRLEPKSHTLPPRLQRGRENDAASLDTRWRLLQAPDTVRAALAAPDEDGAVYQRNIEHFIGTVKLPVGIAGPLRVNGIHAQGDFMVPLATTEAALVASYARGAAVVSAAGGCSAVVTSEGVRRTPGFAFATLFEAGSFVAWVSANLARIRATAEATTRHGKLEDVAVHLQGNDVYLVFTYTTGDASGQNMVTIATDAACAMICAETPVKPRRHFLDANMSGDKKASSLSFQTVRGRNVSAEVRVPKKLVARMLHTTVEAMIDFWRMSALGGVMSGTIGTQGHFANGLTALYLATGQDAACVSESAIGVTRLEATDDGDLYASVTMPNIMVGTVGGGTGLPSQRACLELLGTVGPGSARALAEVAASLCLAGELSIIGAFAAGHFAHAHASHARG